MLTICVVDSCRVASQIGLLSGFISLACGLICDRKYCLLSGLQVSCFVFVYNLNKF